VTSTDGETVSAVSLYSEAIRLGEQLGWVCLPLYERGGRWVPPYQYAHLLDERYSLELIERLWDGHEDAPGIGAIWPRDIVAAEADSESGEAWLARKKLPRTLTFSSRRGPHYLFRGNGHGVNPAPAEGVEVLSRDGGKRLMTLPPTAGKRWWPSLDPTEAPFATLPVSLATLRPKERERVEIRADPIPEGKRTNAMTRIVGKLCSVLPSDAALAAAVTYDETYCRPPLGRARIERMVRDWAQPAGEPYGSTWGPVDLASVIDGERPDRSPQILQRTDGARLLYPGKTHMLSGPYESLKTWLALKACAGQMAAGEHVLFIDFEDDPDVIVDRLRELGVPDILILERFHYLRPDEPLASPKHTESDALAVLDATIEAHPHSLAVVDGLTEALALHGISMNDNTEVARFISLLPRRLVRDGAAALILDHVPHEGGRAIGAQHKVAGLSGAAYLIEPVQMGGRDGESVARLTVKKDRPGYVRSASLGGKRAGDVLVRTDERGFTAVTVEPAQETSDPLGLAPRERRVLEALHGPDRPLYPRQIGDRVVEMGWTQGLRREPFPARLRSSSGVTWPTRRTERTGGSAMADHGVTTVTNPKGFGHVVTLRDGVIGHVTVTVVTLVYLLDHFWDRVNGCPPGVAGMTSSAYSTGNSTESTVGSSASVVRSIVRIPYKTTNSRSGGLGTARQCDANASESAPWRLLSEPRTAILATYDSITLSPRGTRFFRGVSREPLTGPARNFPPGIAKTALDRPRGA
jgi:hypothetical protein